MTYKGNITFLRTVDRRVGWMIRQRIMIPHRLVYLIGKQPTIRTTSPPSHGPILPVQEVKLVCPGGVRNELCVALLARGRLAFSTLPNIAVKPQQQEFLETIEARQLALSLPTKRVEAHQVPTSL